MRAMLTQYSSAKVTNLQIRPVPTELSAARWPASKKRCRGSLSTMFSSMMISTVGME